MKHIIPVLILLNSLISSYATEQFSDILIIGEDTLYLKTFPIDKLGFEKYPYEAPHTGCWRGYIATWIIQNDSLLLDQVEKASPPFVHLDIEKYFVSNNYNPTYSSKEIFAKWYSEELTLYPPTLGYGCVGVSQGDIFLGAFDTKTVILKIEDGIIKENLIDSLLNLRIGDTLTYNLNNYPPGLFKEKQTKVEGVIIAKVDKLVKLKIFSYGVKREKDIERIKPYLRCKKDENEIVINPIYWTKE